MHKLAICKIGQRISFGKIDKNGNRLPVIDTSGGNGEAKAVIDIARKSGKFDITILTMTTKSDYFPPEYKIVDIVKLMQENKLESFIKEQDFDILLLINGTISCYGGLEKFALLDLATYRTAKVFDKKTVFISCDICIPFVADMWKRIHLKPWVGKYNREDHLLFGKNFYMLTQARNLDVLYDILESRRGYVNVFKRENIENFSFEKFPCDSDVNYIPVNPSPEYDLLYGGTLRTGRRIRNIVKWYYNHPSLNIELFGRMDQSKIDEFAKKECGDNFYKPKFADPVNYLEHGKKMNQALATIVIGDTMYEQTDTVQQRAYESMCANVVTFIDERLDRPHNVYGCNSGLEKFLYLQSPDQLEKRIAMLKESSELRAKILEWQQRITNFDKQAWYNEFAEKLLK